MIVSIIVAVAEDRVMGLRNQLPWQLPADMKYFKNMTTGHHVIMGRKTYESLGKPLPNRVNIVITRQTDFNAPGAHVMNNINEALAFAKSNNETECFIIGGAELFQQSMLLVDKIYITQIHHKFEGDTFFPGIIVDDWQLHSSEAHEPDEKNLYPYTFEVYTRRDTP